MQQSQHVFGGFLGDALKQLFFFVVHESGGGQLAWHERGCGIHMPARVWWFDFLAACGVGRMVSFGG